MSFYFYDFNLYSLLRLRSAQYGQLSQFVHFFPRARLTIPRVMVKATIARIIIVTMVCHILFVVRAYKRKNNVFI